MRKTKHIIEYITVIILFLLLRAVPYKIRISIGGFLGILVFCLYKKRRDIAIQNVALSFPDMSFKQQFEICRNSFKNAGKTAMEFIQLSGANFNESFIKKYVIVEGKEYIQKALKKGKGIIAVSPHLGNWELIAAAIAVFGYDLSVIVKRQSNPYVNRFIEKIRRRFDMRIIYRSVAGMHVLRALGKNGIVGFVADQDAGRNGVFVDFLGRTASTARGPARFALSCASPVLLFICVREKNGRLRIIFSEVNGIDYSKTGKGKKQELIESITQLWTKAVEKYVRKYPDQYFWMHRRWKTQPEIALKNER